MFFSMRRIVVLVAAVMSAATAFVPPPSPRVFVLLPLHAEQTPTTTKQEKQQEEAAVLSELDARVLQSMLQEDKLDLNEEENMKKLLERGVAPKSAPTVTTGEEGEEEGPYASQVMKTLGDTKLWKALKRKASDAMESVSIYVSNRIERDAKLLASVGLFALDRAMRDVGRALPSSGQSGAAVGRAMRTAARQVGNSSSYQDMQQQQKQQQTKRLEDVENLYEEFNTPMDEIKSVTQSLRDILSGDASSPSSAVGTRGLRSVAPAGQAKNAERQRRAYRRRKSTVIRQEKEVLNLGRTAGGVVDAAFEMKRELQVESSKPGYRSEGARKAIAAGAAQTARMLEAAKHDGWSRALFGSAGVKEETIRGIAASVDAATVKVEADAQAVAQLLEEEYRVIDRLQECIDNPAETWLMPAVLSGTDVSINEEGLREAVTAMICARDDLEVDGAQSAVNETLAVHEMVERMQQVKGTVDMIVSLVGSCAGYVAADKLRSILYGEAEEDENRASLLTLDQVEQSIAEAVKVAEAMPDSEKVPESISWYDSTLDSHDASSSAAFPVENDIPRSVVAEVVVEATRPHSPGNPDVVFTDVDNDISFEKKTPREFVEDVRMATVEVVSDDDFENAVSSARATSTVSDTEVEDAEKEEDNPFAVVLLRGLDIVLFVSEKILLVGIPKIITVGTTVVVRLQGVGRSGGGYRGWKRIKNTERGAKRY